MYSLSIALGNVSWRLLFKTEETANIAHAILRSSAGTEKIAIEDDFGQYATCMNAHIKGFMLEDLDKSKMGHIEMALHQARVNISATKAAQADPSLRAASMAGGPAILNPMGNGRAF